MWRCGLHYVGAVTVADIGEGFRGSEPLLSSGNDYADWLEQLGWLAIGLAN